MNKDFMPRAVPRYPLCTKSQCNLLLVRSLMLKSLIDKPILPRICISCPKAINMTSPRKRMFLYTDELFEKELSDSLQVKEERKHCLRTVENRKAVLGILHTGFGQSLIFQILLRVIKAQTSVVIRHWEAKRM